MPSEMSEKNISNYLQFYEMSIFQLFLGPIPEPDFSNELPPRLSKFPAIPLTSRNHIQLDGGGKNSFHSDPILSAGAGTGLVVLLLFLSASDSNGKIIKR